jgi:hypothetical protein
VSLKPGLVLAALFLCVYGTFAVSVDLPKATYGFKSDEATYYMIGQSLVHDWDLTYRREDLVRVWKEFPAGPAGVFLKRGKKLDGSPDPARGRLFYGKSFIYPLFAAPLIAIFGTNGFLVLNAICVTLVLLCGYLFLHARAPAWPSAILAAGFVMASVVPIYFVQMMPEVFNFSLACVGYFCWLYKEVAAPERSPRGTQWLFGWQSDLVMAVLLGMATFSKITIAGLFAAPVAWWTFRLTGATFRPKAEAATGAPVASGFSRNRVSLRTALLATAAFVLVAAGLFAANMAISGDWNYQGGGEDVRKSYYYEFPFQNDQPVHPLGVSKSRDTAMAQVIFNPRTFGSNLTHNLEYFFVGRHAGMLPYFFPGVFAMLTVLGAPRKRPLWQWLVLVSALAQGLVFVIDTPYTWSGGGVGNRYFFAGYGVMLFLLPPIETIGGALVPWVAGALFVAPSVLSPFTASFKPADIAKSGPFRLLPVELTLLNDLPVFTEGPARSRVEFGGVTGADPVFFVSFLDDNVHGREADRSFWTRGDSRADLVFKVGGPMKDARFTVAAGPVPVDVTIAIDGRSAAVHLAPGESTETSIPMPGGLPYEKEVEGARLHNVRISTRGGFTPIFFDPTSSDDRYLGARIKPMLDPQ